MKNRVRFVTEFPEGRAARDRSVADSLNGNARPAGDALKSAPLPRPGTPDAVPATPPFPIPPPISQRLGFDPTIAFPAAMCIGFFLGAIGLLAIDPAGLVLPAVLMLAPALLGGLIAWEMLTQESSALQSGEDKQPADQPAQRSHRHGIAQSSGIGQTGA